MVNGDDADLDKIAFAESLKEATENLFYVSETDAEIVPFIGQPATVVTKEEVLRQTGESPDQKVVERDFQQIFDKLTEIQDWFGEEETADAEKFSDLRKLLLENLKDLKVFKIGQVELDVYFVGIDKDGKLAGIKTKAVETG